ncbi:MAG: isoprenylcysteine carboxylmethyltransferase family protein [Ignavibacteriae bacterium]|nr:MAG: isoprenylcysteine carboxylmethyltransferase family protein [Ignavibacteriota bacterium]
MSHSPWWHGAHGEWFVVIQIILMLLIFLGPQNTAGWPIWTFPSPFFWSMGGGILFLAGCSLLLTGLFRLGTNLTPVPYPKENATLIENGPYKLVRHPMYCGGIIMALGWAFFVQGWLTLGYTILLGILFDIKSRREEKWLSEKFGGYALYQQRVRKLIPFVY